MKTDEAYLAGLKVVDNIHSDEELEKIENDTSSGEFIGEFHGNPNDTIEEAFERMKMQVEAKLKEHKKKMYSFRLKTSTVDKIKLKAKKANVPYQTYVNAILDAVAAAE